MSLLYNIRFKNSIKHLITQKLPRFISHPKAHLFIELVPRKVTLHIDDSANPYLTRCHYSSKTQSEDSLALFETDPTRGYLAIKLLLKLIMSISYLSYCDC